MIKSIILRFFLVCFGILIGVLLTEGLLQTLNAFHIVVIDQNKSFANDPLIYSPTLKYKIKPYLVSHCSVVKNSTGICHNNKYGLRGKDYDFNKPKNTYRIIIFGDSLTYGLGVNDEQTYPKYLEKILNVHNKTNVNYEVINMGTTFYGPAQYYYLYEELGKKYNPDLIIVGFHVLTDPWDAYDYKQKQNFYFIKALPDMIMPYSLNQALKEHSYVWRTILSAYYRWVNKQDVELQDVVFHGDKKRFQYDTQLTTTSPVMKEAWSTTEHYMESLIKDAKSHGSKVVIIGLPSPTQIIPDEWKRLKEEGYRSDERLYKNSASRNKLISLCSKYDWSCFDLQNDFRKATDTKSLFLVGDIHFTDKGNMIAANLLYNFLEQRKTLNNP